MPEPDGTVVHKRWTPSADKIKVWSEKASDDDDAESDYISVPVSSTSEDRDGDEFSQDGLTSMRSQYRQGTVNLFPDHGASEDKYARYPWKDIMGRWEDAELADGELYATARLNSQNEDASLLRDYLDEGMAVGFSVGFRVREADGDMREGFEFHDVDLLETSAVGIPSNPDGVAAMSATNAEWRETLDKSLNDTPNGESEDDMTTEKNTDPDDDTDDEENRSVEELRERVAGLDEKMTTVLDVLETRADPDDDGDDEEDDDDDGDGNDDGDDEEDDDSKSLTVTGAAEDVDALDKALDEVRDENGNLDLADAKTLDFASDDEASDDEASEGGEEASEKTTTTDSPDKWGLH